MTTHNHNIKSNLGVRLLNQVIFKIILLKIEYVYPFCGM